MKRIALLLTLSIALMHLAAAQAQNRSEPSAQSVSQQTNQSVPLPEFLKPLDLSAQQQKEIRDVIRDHDAQVRQVWEQFHQLHWQSVELEAGMEAANQLAGHDHSAHHDASRADAGQPAGENSAVKNSRTNTEPKRQDENSGFTASGTQLHTHASKKSSSDDDSPLDVVSMRIIVVQPGGQPREFELTRGDRTNKDSCELCAGYQSELRKLWSEIHRLHGEMVKLETDRLVAIESKLTEDQLTRLEQKNPKSTSESRKGATQ